MLLTALALLIDLMDSLDQPKFTSSLIVLAKKAVRTRSLVLNSAILDLLQFLLRHGPSVLKQAIITLPRRLL